jgi:hypothetical protein
MAVPPPPPPTTGKGTNIVSGRTNPYSNTFSTPPTLYNSSIIPVTYNGFQWSFNAGVSWGRFISGEPFIIVPTAGVNVIGVSYEGHNLPRLVTGFTSAAGQASLQGITFYISGSMKNPPAWWRQSIFNWSESNLGYTMQKWNYDERYSYNINGIKNFDISNNVTCGRNPRNEFTQFPIGLSGGDVLVTAKSNFNENWEQSLFPQGSNRYIAWTDTWMNRLAIEKYGILTSIPEGKAPTYADCYRPPVMWNGSSFSDRPIFYRRDMVKNTENYLLSIPEKNVYGEDILLDSDNIINEISAWNDIAMNYWTSSIMPYHAGDSNQYGLAGYDAYNSDPAGFKHGYHGYSLKIIDQTFQSIFVPWIHASNRRKCLDKYIQYGIDNWGMINAGGLATGGGGHNQCVTVPSLAFLGWIYDRNDIKQWHTNKQLLDRLNSYYVKSGINYYGISGGKYDKSNIKVPQEYYIKSVFSQDYGQRLKLSGANVNPNGFTFGLLTNPDISLYHGLTSPSKSISGATGCGYIYKLSGISCAYAYTKNTLNLNNILIPGNFGVVVAHKDFVARLNALGPSTNLPGPQLPLAVNSSNQILKRGFDTFLDIAEYWGFTPPTLVGSKLKITSGPGAGNTSYTIMDVSNIFIKRASVEAELIEETSTSNIVGTASLIQYANFILDRDFDNNIAPTTESNFMIYPADKDISSWGFDVGVWWEGNTLGNSPGDNTLGNNGNILTSYNQPTYQNIADESMMKNYSVHNLLGITSEQYMVDYIKDVYWDTSIPSYIRRKKALGSSYLGSIYDSSNILGGNVIVQMLGITGATFLPRSIDLNDLQGSSDNIPAVPLDGITLSFSPQYIQSYSVSNGSGTTYSGWGKVFDNPQTILKITAIIDDKIFIQQSQFGLYQLLSELKLKFGPFMTDDIIIEESGDDDQYKDRVAVYGFGAPRTTGNIVTSTTSTDYVRKIPTMETLANSNQLAELVFYSNKYSMAGSAGILPNNNETLPLTTSYGFKSIARNGNLIIIDVNDDVVDLTASGQFNFSDLWYCISGVTMKEGSSGVTFMANEYDFSNWKKADVFGIFSGTKIGFYDDNLPASGSGHTYNINNSNDKLIFFKYLINKDLSNTEFRELEVPLPTGIAQSDYNKINSTNYAGWTGTELYKIDKIDGILINNAASNAGYMRITFNNSSVSDYRRKAYNHFRLWFNNYYDLEGKNGIPAFSSRMESVEGLEDTIQYYDRIKLQSSSNGYFSTNANVIQYNQIIGSDYGHNGFYNTYIRGLTFNMIMPKTPQTLLYITGATS